MEENTLLLSISKPINGLTYSSQTLRVANYTSIKASVFSDKSGLLSIDFSLDGQNWDSTTDYTYTSGTSTFSTSASVVSQYCRIRYESVDVQVMFRLQVFAGNFTPTTDVIIDKTGLAVSGIVLSSNSTSTPFNAPASFTGTPVDVSAYSSILIYLKCDNNCFVYTYFSTDGINFPGTPDGTYTYTANEIFSQRVSILAKYFKLIVNNNGGASASIYLQSLASTTPVAPSSAITEGTISTLNSTNVLAGLGYSGTYEDVSKYTTVTITLVASENGIFNVEFCYASSGSPNYMIEYNYVSENGAMIKKIPVTMKYMRVYYMSTTGFAPSSFKLQTILGFQQTDEVKTATENLGVKIDSLLINTVNDGNSSTTPLTSLDTFTGASVDVTKFASVIVNVFTDKASILYIEFSQDEAVWDFSDIYSVLPSTALSLNKNILSKFFRVRLTNIIPENQTVLRLQSILSSKPARDNSKVSYLNSSTQALDDATTFTGEVEDVSKYVIATISLLTDQSGILYVDFSVDPTADIWDHTTSFTILADTNVSHKIPITRQFFRVRLENNSGFNQTSLRLSTIYSEQDTSTQIINAQHNNVPVDISADAQGYLNINMPKLPFGSLHTEKLTPIFQTDGVYSVNPEILKTITGLGGTCTSVDSSLTCQSSANAFGNATLQSKKRLRYRAGQPMIMRFTALFSNNTESTTYQIIGIGSPENGYYICCKGTDFGILHIDRAYRHIVSIQITVGASSGGNATVTLNSVAYTVALTASGNVNRTAWEIAYYFRNLSSSGWIASVVGDTILFLANSSGAKSGTYSISGVGVSHAAASTIQVGAAGTETYITQNNFNMDKLNGTGASKFTIDRTKLNIFEIDIEYLGAGTIQFKIVTASAGKHHSFIPFHVINNPNNRTNSHISNPSMPFTMSVYKTASDINDVSISCASLAGFIGGDLIRHGARISYLAANASVNSTNIQVLLIVHNNCVYVNKANQSVIHLRSLSVACKGSNNVLTQFYILRNPTITGNVVMANTESGTSCALSSTTTGLVATYTNASQLLWSLAIGEVGEQIIQFDEITEEFGIEPNDYIAVCAKTTSSTSNAIISLNTREDQ